MDPLRHLHGGRRPHRSDRGTHRADDLRPSQPVSLTAVPVPARTAGGLADRRRSCARVLQVDHAPPVQAGSQKRSQPLTLLSVILPTERNDHGRNATEVPSGEFRAWDRHRDPGWPHHRRLDCHDGDQAAQQRGDASSRGATRCHGYPVRYIGAHRHDL